MGWNKKGLIFVNNPDFNWAKQYAGIPTAELIDFETIRIYYYSMDEKMDGRISFIDVDSQNPSRIKYVHNQPILDIGEPGMFDDCGVCPSCIVKVNDKKRLYYLGVQRTEKVPYLYFAGVAEQDESGMWRKLQSTPILDRTSSEPFVRSATTIMEHGGKLMMWYVSAFKWIEVNQRKVPSYIIRHAVSENGINWMNKGDVCIHLDSNSDEYGFGRPWVIYENDTFKMWYSVRSISKNYRIGYAESKNGLDWMRKDNEVGIDVSAEGWDSQMICYPCIVDAGNKRYLFHNGNSHGASGFGYAEWTND